MLILGFTFVCPRTENSPCLWWRQSGGILAVLQASCPDPVILQRKQGEPHNAEKSRLRQILIHINEEFQMATFHSQGAATA